MRLENQPPKVKSKTKNQTEPYFTFSLLVTALLKIIEICKIKFWRAIKSFSPSLPCTPFFFFAPPFSDKFVNNVPIQYRILGHLQSLCVVTLTRQCHLSVLFALLKVSTISLSPHKTVGGLHSAQSATSKLELLYHSVLSWEVSQSLASTSLSWPLSPA